MKRLKYLGEIDRNDKYLLVISNLIFVYVFYILYKKKITKEQIY